MSTTEAAPGVRTPLQRAIDVATRLLEIVGVVSILLIMVHTLANVVGRYFFHTPLTGTNEYVANWYMPLTVFIGFILAKSRREHIEASIVFDRVSPKNKRLLAVIAGTVSAVVFAVLTWITLQEAMRGARIGLATITGVVYWPVLFILPFSFGVLAVLYAIDAANETRLIAARSDALRGDSARPESGEADVRYDA